MIKVEVSQDELVLYNMKPGNTYPALNDNDFDSVIYAPVDKKIADTEVSVIEENGVIYLGLPDSVMNEYIDDKPLNSLDITPAVDMMASKKELQSSAIITYI